MCGHVIQREGSTTKKKPRHSNHEIRLREKTKKKRKKAYKKVKCYMRYNVDG